MSLSPGAFLDGQLLAHLRQRGRRGASLEELLTAVGSGADEEDVAQVLTALQSSGEVVEWGRRWYDLAFTDWRVGTLERLVGGDGVVECAQASFLVRRPHLKGARKGDRVLLKRLRVRRSRRGPRLPEAAVVRVLAQATRSMIGTLESDGRGGLWLVPFDPKLDLEVGVEGGDELAEGTFVVVELDKVAADRRHRRLRGKVVEVLGRLEEPDVDVKVVLRHFEIPERFSEECLTAAAALPSDPRPEDGSERLDLRRMRVVTVDGESARDFDDAFSLEELDRGYRLGVHIADVSHYVAEGGVLDREAYRRGTSVYFPDRAVPMLPESLSNELCSLKPGRPRLTVSVFLDFNPQGEVLSSRFQPSLIESAARLTYSQVRDILERKGSPDEEPWLVELLTGARRLMEALHRRRRDRGSLDFDLPEGDVVLSTDGNTVGIQPSERHVGHRIIEEFMIAANEAVARELEERDAPALYRIHDPPSAERLAELRQTLHSLGLELRSEGDTTAADLQRLLASVEGRREEGLISTLVLRAQQQARYDPACRGHFALASSEYTHFTSPIRRYPDLWVHRRLKEVIAEPEAEGGKMAGRELRLRAEHLSRCERRAERAERELLQWKKVRFLASRIGESFQGSITGVQPFGLFVQLTEYTVDGLVPIASLGDDYYVFEQEAHRLRGERHGRLWRLGDPVQVVLTGVSERYRSLDLAIGGLEEPAGPMSSRRRHRRGRRRARRGEP